MKRAKFSLSNYKLLSCNMGELIPCGLMEVLPGDTIQHGTNVLVRASPLNAPVMHPTHLRVQHWFIPSRILWDNFENFITGGPDGSNTDTVPQITSDAEDGFLIGSLADYLGVPPEVPSLAVNALPFRAYNLVWNEWYRDQDLQTKLAISTANGPDTTTSIALQNVAWEKDYFTSARPWEQKGPQVTVPIGTTAPIRGIGVEDGVAYSAIPANTRSTDNTAMAGLPGRQIQAASQMWIQGETIGTTSSTNLPRIYADLAQATGVSVNDLREALAIQRYEEARARYGSRYVEYLRYLGVRSSDARLQRPEYLGGGKQTIQFSEVLQTAEGTDPVGELRGHGIGHVRSNRYRRYIEEHGYILSVLSIKPKTIYAQGLPRMWNRLTKEDFWQKEFQHIGQQAILNKEVYAAHGSPEATFGYQDRFDEYRRTESTIAGEFRTSALDFWHEARIFGTSPALNADFVKSNPTKRIFAVTDPEIDSMYCMVMHSIQARRLLSYRGSSYTY